MTQIIEFTKVCIEFSINLCFDWIEILMNLFLLFFFR